MSYGNGDVIDIDLASDTTAGEKARQKLEQIAAQAHQLKDELDNGTISWERYNAESAKLSAQANRANAAFDAAQKGAKQIGESSGVATYKLMVMSQTLDDLQYVPEMGLRPILNNLTQFSPILAIAAIGVNTLYKNFHYLTDLFGEGHVKTQAEDLEELGKKAKLTADEFERLGRFQRGEKAVKDLREARPEAEKKADAATIKAIGEAGQQQVIAGLLKTNPAFVKNQGDALAAKDQLSKAEKALEDAKDNVAGGSEDFDQINRAEKRLVEARENLAKATDATAEQLVANAANSRDNPLARKQLADAIRKNPAAFGPKGGDLLSDLDAIGKGEDPAEKRKQVKDAKDKADREYDQDLAKRVQEAEAAANKKSADYDKRVDELAGPLQHRYNENSARGEDVQSDNIEAELKNAGLSDEEAAKYANAVLEKLENGFDRELSKRASEKGTSREDAAQGIVDQADKERKDKLDAQVNKARQGAEQAEKDRADQLKRATAGTGYGSAARDALMRAQFSANPEQQIERLTKSITEGLIKQGMDPKQAKLAAEEDVQAKRDQLADEVAKRSLSMDQPEVKAPEQRDFLATAKALSFGDIPKDSLNTQKSMLDRLASIDKKVGGPALLAE